MRFISFPSEENNFKFKKFSNFYIIISILLFFIFFVTVPHIQKYFFPEFANSGKWTVVLAVSLILLNLGTYMTQVLVYEGMDIKLYIVIFQVLFNFMFILF